MKSVYPNYKSTLVQISQMCSSRNCILVCLIISREEISLRRWNTSWHPSSEFKSEVRVKSCWKLLYNIVNLSSVFPILAFRAVRVKALDWKKGRLEMSRRSWVVQKNCLIFCICVYFDIFMKLSHLNYFTLTVHWTLRGTR